MIEPVVAVVTPTLAVRVDATLEVIVAKVAWLAVMMTALVTKVIAVYYQHQ